MPYIDPKVMEEREEKGKKLREAVRLHYQFEFATS
jgi:hypothetical protein